MATLYTEASSSPISVVAPPTEERRKRSRASSGWFDAYVGAEQTLRIFAGGVRR